jgi:hypothetical protein
MTYLALLARDLSTISGMTAEMLRQLAMPGNQKIMGDTKFAKYTDAWDVNRWVAIATRGVGEI